MRVGYLGPEGSYSFLASKALAPDCELVPYSTFPAVFASLNKETDFIVIPIENTLNGGVMQNIDLLQAYEGAYAVKKCDIKIEHRFVTRKGADINKIKRIYSHPQALEQCAKYLQKNFPKAELIAAPSTSAGLKMIESCSDGAIAGAHTAEEGLVLSENNIADVDGNYTHFLLVRLLEPSEEIKTGRIYFSATCPNVTGSLLSLLQSICDCGFNMTKIESRPVKDKKDEYRFFIEAEGDYSDPAVRKALKEIALKANSFKLLGCY